MDVKERESNKGLIFSFFTKMKPDEDDCWRLGRDTFCAENFPDYPFCSWDYNRCVECLYNGDCPSDRKYCTWDKRCVECEVDAQCRGDNEFCIDDVCREKTCVDLAEEGFPDYCKDRHPTTPVCDYENGVCVECVVSSDCDAGEGCSENVCVEETEKDCVDKQNEGVYDYCEKLYPERPICHSQLRECVECQFDTHCNENEECVNTRCIDKEWECEFDTDCMSNYWKCVDHECVKKICSDFDDPDAFCDEKHSGWRCRDDGVCVKCLEDEDCPGGKRCANNKCVDKTCDEYPVPDWWCRDHFGESYICVDKECKLKDEQKCSDFLTTIEADRYCRSENASKPYCDFGTGECEECVLEQHCPPFWICSNNECRECLNNNDCDVEHRCTQGPNWICVARTCSEIEYCEPDTWCERKYGEGYICKDDECVLDDCDGLDSKCPKGYYCPENECVWGCENNDNCPDLKPHCSQETGNCEECLGPVHCDSGYDCIDHKCVEGLDCQHDDSLCEKNEYCDVDTCVIGCRDSINCGEWTPHCSQATGMCEECVYDLHCEPGHECDANYKCVWVGYECENDSECPKNWMCHDQRRECVLGCQNGDNCSSKTPHCSQATDHCEECWSSEHCEWWQECNENYICIARHGHEECIEGDVKPGYRCRDGVWVRKECAGPEDCLGHESCIDGLCIDNEYECEDVDDCVSGFFCDTDGSGRCEPQICMDHSGCGPGMCCGLISELGGENGCEPCSTYPCKDLGPCPAGWICSEETGYCIEAECEWPFECGEPKYFDCIDGFCVGLGCEDAEDPQQWCNDERGSYYRCHEGNCILLDCTSYSDPDMMCMDVHGESYRCEGGKCIDLGPEGAEDPDKICVDQLGVDEAFWNYDTQECDVPDCDTVQDPDNLCLQLKDERYKCRDGECRRGREGEECENYDECMTGLTCQANICIKYECYSEKDCGDNEWCKDHICIPMNNKCDNDDDCRDDHHCDPYGVCVPDACNDHYDCVLGNCCNESGVCISCRDLTCFGSFDCRMGWRCNLKTSKCELAGCQRDTDCDSGYYCDLDDGECKEIKPGPSEACWGNWDCPDGQVCRGQYITWPVDQFPFGLEWGQGICVEEDARLIRIEGIDDEKTCDYCKAMKKKIGVEGAFPLPSYHEHCRCYAVYID